MGKQQLITTPSNLTSDQEVGRRLTQAAAAAKAGMARTTLVAVEQGLRRIRTKELLRLAKLYGVTANAVLRQEAVHIDLVPRFRRHYRTADTGIDHAVALLNDLVCAEVELEDALGIARQFCYPPHRLLARGPVEQQAEDDALELRRWLGLGLAPVLDVVSVAEIQLDIRVYLRPLDSSISGLFAWDRSTGACMLLNANHPNERIQFSAAHELAHFVASRDSPEVLLGGGRQPSRRIEHYANHFASAFLMPRYSVRKCFAELTSEETRFTRRHVILLAHKFHVSRQAMVHRLEELGFVGSDTWEWFKLHGGISGKQASEVLGTSAKDFAKPPPIPLRLALLVLEAWGNELYSESQLCSMLKLSRHALRTVLDEYLDMAGW